MQAVRAARPRALLRTVNVVARRNIAATAGAAPATTSSAAAVIPLSNVEAQWEKLSQQEQLSVHQQLEELQKRDWKTLSLDEKKAAYYVAFGPHGPRAPVNPPGTVPKILASIVGALALTTVLYSAARAAAPPPPKTMTKEWQEASNERAIDQKMNPIYGITSEGYSGKGFVTTK